MASLEIIQQGKKLLDNISSEHFIDRAEVYQLMIEAYKSTIRTFVGENQCELGDLAPLFESISKNVKKSM